VPIYIGSYAWNTNFYPADQMVTNQANCIIQPQGMHFLRAGQILVPEVPDGQYQIEVVLTTFVYNSTTRQWVDVGLVKLGQPQTLMVVHVPRYRAFISRSNRVEDRPLGDLVVHTIQQWGFDTHTVGINEMESDPRRVPARIIEEILKADCLLGIATPRDVSAITNLTKTLTWLQNEVSFAYLAQKPFLIFSDQAVHLEGLLATPDIPVLGYDVSQLGTLISTIDRAMPVVRQAIVAHQQAQLAAQIEQAEMVIAYGAFVAGRVQGAFPGPNRTA